MKVRRGLGFVAAVSAAVVGLQAGVADAGLPGMEPDIEKPRVHTEPGMFECTEFPEFFACEGWNGEIFLILK